MLKASSITPMDVQPLLPKPNRKHPENNKSTTKPKRNKPTTNTKPKSKTPRHISTSTICAHPDDNRHEIREAASAFISTCFNKPHNLSLPTIIEYISSAYKQQQKVSNIANKVHAILHNASGGDCDSNKDNNDQSYGKERFDPMNLPWLVLLY